VSSRSQKSVDAAVARLGESARGVAADNGDDAAAELLVAAATEAWGRLDGALISVGGPPATDALGATDEQWRTSFESVFLGAVRLVRAIAPHLGPGSAIGLVLSSSAKSPIPGLEISNGLRPGLSMWAKSLADQLGPSGIRVISLLPGRILTDRMRALSPTSADQERDSQTIPLRRYGDPVEFGKAAAYLISPAASYITGCAIPIDGGLLRLP
jgi:3-oxoacyl-[acyl-carrier protein] reductase